MLATTLLALVLSSTISALQPVVIGVTDFPPYFIVDGDRISGKSLETYARKAPAEGE